MIAKFFLIAFVCVSFAQVNGESIEESIRRAVEQVKGLSLTAERKVENAIRDFNAKHTAIKMASTDFVQKEVRVEEQTKQTLRRLADQLREKARETNKPPSVIECINNAENEAIKNIEPYRSQFQTDLKKLEKTDLSALNAVGKPLEETKNSLTKKYEDAVEKIKACKNNTSLNRTLDAIRKEYDSLFADIGRVYTRMTQIYNNFKKDGSSLFGFVSRQVRQVQSQGIRAIKQCFYNRME